MMIGDQDVAEPREAAPVPAPRPGAGARAAAVTLAVSLAVLTGILGYVDGTGLFAPENWLDAGFVPTSPTSPAWATVVCLPLLVAGSALLCHRIARRFAAGTPTRWAFWAAWSGTVLAAVLAKVVYTLLLLVVAGPHALHLVPATGAVLAECGLSGAKYAFLGLFVAGPAAVGYHLSTRRTRDRAPTAPPHRPGRSWSPVWSLLGSLVAAQATHTTFGWLEGGNRLVLPLAGWAGAFLATRFTWRRLRRRLTGRSTAALCATTCAASGLGFLVPWLVDGVVHGFGGGLFPVVGALTHVGTGIVAGLVTCSGGLCWRVLGATPLGRLVHAFTVPSWRRYATTGLVLALVLAGAVVLAPSTSDSARYPVPGSASPDSGGLLALTVRRGTAPVIADSAGRQVLLRGVNVNQLVDYGQPDPAKPTVRPLTEADYALMAGRYGFNVQRLSLSWSALEPRRGVIDDGYLARVRTAVDQAARHGVYTVLDMHQDTYSRFVTATPGTTCRPGASPEFGNDGAPEWATLTDGAKGCGFLGRDLSPNVENAFTHLYADTDGIATEFGRAWAALAKEFAGNTAVAGYDLLNEPGPGNAPGVTSALLLGRLYQQLITAIRSAESGAAGGYHHLVLFEPSILWSGLGFDATPPVGFSDDPALVFSPHLYSESISMDQGLGVTLTTIEHGYALAERMAGAYGVPLWSGEWGWFGDLEAVRDRYDRFLGQQNAHRLGSAVWVWKKACGDPQTGATDPLSGGLQSISCPDGADVSSPPFLTTALAQAYPRATPGRLTSLSSDPGTVDLRLSGAGTGVLDVWVPGATAPIVTSTGLSGVTAVPRPDGGWLVTGYAAGAYTLTVH